MTFSLFYTQANAQLFSKKDMAMHQGFMTFHNASLNNKSNTNKKTSWVTEVDKNLYLSRFSSVNSGIGLGNYKSLDSSFAPFESSNFMRLKVGLVLHLPQRYSVHNLSPRNFNPLVKIAYNFDFFDRHYESMGGNRVSSSLRLGLGFVAKINHYTGFIYEFSHNQRVAPDYRSYYQHTFGIIINLVEPYKPY